MKILHGELENTFRSLREYIEGQWIGRVTPQHFSVFRQRHRTNNVMESYHRRLNSKLVRHPGVWALMGNHILNMYLKILIIITTVCTVINFSG